MIFWILYYFVLYVTGGFCFTLLWRKWIGKLDDEFPIMIMFWPPILILVIMMSPIIILSFWLKDLQDKLL